MFFITIVHEILVVSVVKFSVDHHLSACLVVPCSTKKNSHLLHVCMKQLNKHIDDHKFESSLTTALPWHTSH